MVPRVVYRDHALLNMISLPTEPTRDAVRIFLVEDSPVIHSNLVEAMQESVRVEIVGSAVNEADAVAWLQSSPEACDVALIDIFLQSGNGLGVLKALQSLENAPRRVVLSNHATADVRAACEKLGVDKVFDKSNELEEMLAWLRRFSQSDRAAPALPT